MYNLGEAVGYIRFDMSNFLSDAQRAKSATQDIENEFDKLGNVCKTLEGIVVSSFAAIGTAIVAGLSKAVDVGSQFEASMSQVAATMGMTAKDVAEGSSDFQKLSDAAKEMGETTKFSASQAADALNYLALAGYDAEQSISTLPTVLNLAAAGGMDLARASDMITDAASALGLELEDMSLFADKMAKAAQSSNTSVEQLGDAILTIGGTARNLKGGINELNTALGILANNGIKGSEGGTALRQVILNLTAPSEKAAKAIDELGLKVKDAAGDVRPLNEIFRDLDEILQSKGITGSADKIEALSSIFDARQLKSATALLNNYGESWDRLYDKIDNAEGAASQMAETMQTNLKGALTILGSTAEGFGITIYESIEGSFKKATEEAIKQLSNLNQAFKSAEMQDALQKISDAISGLIVKLSEFLSEIIPKLVKGLAQLIDDFDKISAIFAGFVTTIGLASAGMVAFKIQADLVTQSLIAQKVATLAANAALLANPYSLVALGIGVLVTALVGEYQQQQENIAQLDKLNDKYYEAENAVNQMADNYDKEIEKARELNNSRDEEIDRVSELLSIIQKNVDESGKIISNSEQVKDAIDELNSLIPINIQYQNNQIDNYAKLVQSSQLYCEQLKNEAILEAKKEEYKTASVAYDEAIKKREELTNNFLEAQQAYQDVSYAWEKMNNEINGYVAEYQEKAKAAGMEYRDYVNAQYEATKRALDSTQDAYLENERIIHDSSETLKNAELDIAKTSNEIYAEQLKTGQEVTGIYASESEARIGIAQIEADRIAEINRQSHQDRIDEAQESAEDITNSEELLENALEQLEIQYNTGVIESDEEYHKKRLELLEQFHGEWTKKSSGWLKTELDWEQKQKDNALKEEEERLKKEKQEKDRQQKEEERAANEAKRKREQEIKDAEQALREKERLYKEETNKKIEEIDRRKERDESYTDEQYLADLTALHDTIDKKNDLWQQLDDKIFRYQKKVTENNKKELEQQLKDDYQAIKDRKDIEEGYTDEQYLEDLKKFQSKLDTESDLYKQASKEIININKSIRKEQQETADTAFKAWEKGFDSLKSEAQSAYDEITNKQENLQNKLNNEIELYETKTKKVKNLTTGLWEDVEVKQTSTKFLKDQTKELEKYQEQLQKLSDRGLSDELMQKILGMDEESAREYVKALNNMSDDGLKAYDEAYSNLIKKNKEFSEKYYEDEVEAFKSEWGNKIEEYLNTLPQEARAASKELISEFIKGLSDADFDTSNDAFNQLFESLTNTFQENAEKGEIFKNYGKDGIKTIEKEMQGSSKSLYETTYDIGKKSGESYIKGWHEAIDQQMKYVLDFFDSSNYTTSPNLAFNNNSKVDKNNGLIINSKQEQLSAEQLRAILKETQPDGDVILNVDGDTFGKIARKELNRLSQKSGNLRLSI